MKNWVYYMQRGLQSMWSKKPKGNKKYAIDFKAVNVDKYFLKFIFI